MVLCYSTLYKYQSVPLLIRAQALLKAKELITVIRENVKFCIYVFENAVLLFVMPSQL